MRQITKAIIVMERRSRDSNNGTYYPSFFNIYIPTYEIPDMHTFANNSEQFKAYFLHEYIHFIQDLTTIPGLSNICVVVDYLKWTVKQGSNGIIKVPLVPIQRDGYRLLNNAELHRIREGHSTMKTKDGCNLSVSKIVKYYFSDDSYVDDKGTWKNLSCSVDFKDQNVSIRRNAYCSGERSSLLLQKIEIL